MAEIESMPRDASDVSEEILEGDTDAADANRSRKWGGMGVASVFKDILGFWEAC
jgi:hypothetical protein